MKNKKERKNYKDDTWIVGKYLIEKQRQEYLVFRYDELLATRPTLELAREFIKRDRKTIQYEE
jgi:hypothetical protein